MRYLLRVEVSRYAIIEYWSDGTLSTEALNCYGRIS
jgi:hypothetical protein